MAVSQNGSDSFDLDPIFNTIFINILDLYIKGKHS